MALGFGFRCGFLGLLHMEIIQERLEREYGLTLITTAPTVVYRVMTTKGEVLEIDNPAELPPPSSIESFEEPFILASVITPERYMGAILKLCQERRGIQRGIHFLDPTRVIDQLRDAAERSHSRFLRQAQVAHAGLCVARL